MAASSSSSSSSSRAGQIQSKMDQIGLFDCLRVRRQSSETRTQRPRIDRSMIGPPTDFKHTQHIGAGDSFDIMVPSAMSTASAEGGDSSVFDASSGGAFGTTPPSPTHELTSSSSSSSSPFSPHHMANLRPIAKPLISTTPMQS